MNKIIFILSIFLLPFSVAAQNVNIPDAEFKRVLVNNVAINTNGDSEIQYSEAAAYSGTISISEWDIIDEPYISSLVGLEAFTSLTGLELDFLEQLGHLDIGANTKLTKLICTSCRLSSLDLSSNTALTYLDCAGNQLSSLDLSANTLLSYLGCSSNQLKSLDVSTNTALTSLDCRYNQLSSLDVNSNTALQELYCSYNQLSVLDVSGNISLTNLICSRNQLNSLVVNGSTALQELICDNNQLSSLDLSANTLLSYLGCSSNQLKSLDVSTNTALNILYCYDNQLSVLDVSGNISLTNLICSRNQLNSLVVNGSTALQELICGSNLLSSLDVSVNTALSELYCHDNQLSSLDVRSNIALTSLSCGSNQLISLDVRNGNNKNLRNFSTTDNPLLTCISVDNVEYAEYNWTNIDAWTSFDFDCTPFIGPIRADFSSDFTSGCTPFEVKFTDQSQSLTSITSWFWDFGDGQTSEVQSPVHTYTTDGDYTVSLTVSDGTNNDIETRIDYISVGRIVKIPDANFKAALVANTDININGDNEIQFCEARRYSGMLDVSQQNIWDMSGLEHFIHLTGLNCSDNNFRSFDLRRLTALTLLDCSGNWLNSLDVSSNKALKSLNCYDSELRGLYLKQNIALTSLDCSDNDLERLDLRSNIALTSLDCSKNRLVELDMRNGHNSLITAFDATQNFKLECISVDDVDYSQANWKNIEFGTSFQPYCSFDIDFSADIRCGSAPLSVQFTDQSKGSIISWFWDFGDGQTSTVQLPTHTYANDGIYSVSLTVSDGIESDTKIMNEYIFVGQYQNIAIPDEKFKTALISNPNINTNGDREIQYCEALAFSGVLDVSGLDISDMTGLEAFTLLTRLYCSGNSLNSLDISANQDLVTLVCDSNELCSLDVSKNLKLEDLGCGSNLLSSLDVSTNLLLENLTCEANLLDSLDVSQNKQLYFLACNSNQLSSLDVSGNPKLTGLDCSFNQLSSLDVNGSTALQELICNSNQLSSLDISTNQDLVTLVCDSNELSSLDVSKNLKLEDLGCGSNLLSSLDASTNLLLENLTCEANLLDSLDVSQNKQLYFLACNSNQLSSLDVSGNPKLTGLDCSFNQLNSLNVRNGNNYNITDFWATNNPSLICISVDDVEYATTNWTEIDAEVSFKLDCEITGLTNISKQKFLCFPNPVSDILTIESEILLSKVDFYSYIGNKVKVVNSDFEFIRLNQLSNGVYILKIYSENGIEIIKVVKY